MSFKQKRNQEKNKEKTKENTAMERRKRTIHNYNTKITNMKETTT